jgi:putative transposase
MHFEQNVVYHIYNRGNNKQRIFFNDDNYLCFVDKVRKLISPCCEILSWCLMPNHFHFMVVANEISCEEKSSFGKTSMQILAYKIGILLSSYAQLINKQNCTTGSLFQQKTKAKPIFDFSYIIHCMHYIHQNPLRAGLIGNDLSAWKYSSFLEYSGLANHSICHPNRLFELTGYNSNSFITDSYALIEDKGRFYL